MRSDLPRGTPWPSLRRPPTELSPPVPTTRTLVAMVDASPEQVAAVPRTVRQLRDVALAAGCRVRVTYALVQLLGVDGTAGDLRESICVRIVRGDGERGWACWVNGSPSGAQWRDGSRGVRNVGVGDLSYLVAGQEVPAREARVTTRGVCPWCGLADVRVKSDGFPYAHRVRGDKDQQKCEMP